jgi:Flp pilus assembly protein TadD/predicted Zn-dependent protease with MMP-like domain
VQIAVAVPAATATNVRPAEATISSGDDPEDEPAAPASAPFGGDAPPLRHCFAANSGHDEPTVGDLLDEAGDRLDRGEASGSLDCADEASRLDDENVAVQAARGDALAQLGRLDDARTAYTLALALDPDDPQTLAEAADFYVNRDAPSRDHTEIGLALAERGQAMLKDDPDPHLASALALSAAEGLDDLGRSDEALTGAEAALAAEPDNEDAQYEKGLALFDLCRFSEARQSFQMVLATDPSDAFAHAHLGLTLEQLGDSAGAQAELTRAEGLSPNDFPPPPAVSDADFDQMVATAVAGLPPELSKALSQARLQVVDLPELADLMSVDPPYPPTILGLFRGSPLVASNSGAVDRAADSGRSVVIYRKNLLRAVTSVDELRQQIGVTLLHEIGHLRGEDEDELRARGLE